MRKWISRVLLGLLLIFAALLTFGPTERVGVLPMAAIPPDASPQQAADSVANAERLIEDVRDNARKEVIWAGEPGEKTPLSVVYVHGFTASKAELRPVPDRVAEELGANLFYTRLAGHGRPDAALGRARAEHWMLDMAEALEVGRAIGEKVLVVGTSMGGALTAISAAEPAGREGVAGYVFVAPAFEIQATGASLLTRPFARWWAPLLLGETRSGEPRAEGQAEAWTLSYPTEALVPLAAVAQTANYTDYSGVTRPALFVLSDEDETVSPEAIREVALRWGGAAETLAVTPGPEDDPNAHVLAGDILSPGLTPVVTRAILDWARANGVAPDAAEAGDTAAETGEEP